MSGNAWVFLAANENTIDKYYLSIYIFKNTMKPNQFHILLSLAGHEQHGYGIMQEVLERTGGKVRLWPATLYGTIKRLMEEGLIEEVASPAPHNFDTRR